MTQRSYGRLALYVLLSAAAVWLGFSVLLPLALPFLLGLGAALLLDPAVRLCLRKTNLPRWGCTGLCLTLFYGLLGLGLYVLLRQLCLEAASLSRSLPALLTELAAPMARLQEQLRSLAARLPDGFGQAAEDAVTRFFASGSVLTEKLPEMALSAATAIVAAVPEALVFLVTAILSSYFISSDLPGLRKAAKKLLPPAWRGRAVSTLADLKTALGGWLRAQLMLMGCTFVVLSLGLMLLGVGMPLLVGGGIALIDALPILGTGTVLLPWSLVCFLRGQARRGVGLLLLYAAAALGRTVLEPKLLGKQMGLHPLLTLAAIYVGYRLFGVLGMILLPIAAMVLERLWKQLGSSFHHGQKG
jgi:sporulation integral membrane protein YtvI